jgi:uncharacterized protein
MDITTMQRNIEENFKELAEENIIPVFKRQEEKEELEKKGAVMVPFLDLIVCFRIIIGREDDETASILLMENQIDRFDLDVDKLIDLAKAHAFEQMTARPMQEVLEELMGTDMSKIVPDDLLTIVTNNDGIMGAGVIFSEKVREYLNQTFGKELVVIPSSKHEVIVASIPQIAAEEFCEMIEEVNATEVSPEDVLSDHPYVLSNGEITILS